LGLENSRQLNTHYLRGGIFENMVVAELVKKRYNSARLPGLYFWRDKAGMEIDCLFESNGKPVIVEAKSGVTVAEDAFANIRGFRALEKAASAFLVYGGDEAGERKDGRLVPWRECASII
jgi:predicted AAA+ superfamily ATPase